MKNNSGYRVFRVFLSSSFQDMHLERDYLNARVFPAIDAWLAGRGWRLQALDLRGSTANPARSEEEAVLQMCLTGIDQCRPFFVGLIGDRYGWVPEGEAAEQAIEEICRQSGRIEPHELLGKSVTHMEVVYGLRAMAHDNCFFYFRDLENSQDAPDVYRDGVGLQADLRQEIVDLMEEEYWDNIKSYSARWQSGKLEGLAALGDMIERDLKAAFEAQLEQEQEQSSRVRDRAEFYLQQKLLHSTPLPEARLLTNFALGKSEADSQMLLLRGAPGSGKSTALAQCRQALERQGCFVIPYVGGLDAESAQAVTLIEYLMEQLKGYLTQHGHPLPDLGVRMDDYPTDTLKLCHAVADHTRLVVLVDNLDEMEATKLLRQHLWVPEVIPLRMRLILVASDAFTQPREAVVYAVEGKRSEATLRGILQGQAARRGKRLEEGVLNLAARKAVRAGGSPLYAKILSDYLMSMTAADYLSGGGATAHLDWMERQILAMPEDLESAYAKTLARAGGALGINLVNSVVALLGLNPHGLLEADLRQALGLYGWRILQLREEAKQHALSVAADKEMVEEFFADGKGPVHVIHNAYYDPSKTSKITFGSQTVEVIDPEQATRLEPTALLALRGFLLDHLSPFADSGYWNIEHAPLRDYALALLNNVQFGMLYGTDESFLSVLSGVMVDTMRYLPKNNSIAYGDYLDHCYKSRRAEEAVEAICEAEFSGRHAALADHVFSLLKSNTADTQEGLHHLCDLFQRTAQDNCVEQAQALYYVFLEGFDQWLFTGRLPVGPYGACCLHITRVLESLGVQEQPYLAPQTGFYLQALTYLIRCEETLKMEEEMARHLDTLAEQCERLHALEPEDPGVLEPLQNSLKWVMQMRPQQVDASQMSEAIRKQLEQELEERMRRAPQGGPDLTCLVDLVRLCVDAAEKVQPYSYEAALDLYRLAHPYREEGVELSNMAYNAFLLAAEKGMSLDYNEYDLYRDRRELDRMLYSFAVMSADLGHFDPAKAAYETVLYHLEWAAQFTRFDMNMMADLGNIYRRKALMCIRAAWWSDAIDALEHAADCYGRIVGHSEGRRDWLFYKQCLELLSALRLLVDDATEEYREEIERASTHSSQPVLEGYQLFTNLAEDQQAVLDRALACENEPEARYLALNVLRYRALAYATYRGFYEPPSDGEEVLEQLSSDIAKTVLFLLRNVGEQEDQLDDEGNLQPEYEGITTDQWYSTFGWTGSDLRRLYGGIMKRYAEHLEEESEEGKDCPEALDAWLAAAYFYEMCALSESMEHEEEHEDMFHRYIIWLRITHHPDRSEHVVRLILDQIKVMALTWCAYRLEGDNMLPHVYESCSELAELIDYAMEDTEESPSEVVDIVERELLPQLDQYVEMLMDTADDMPRDVLGRVDDFVNPNSELMQQPDMQEAMAKCENGIYMESFREKLHESMERIVSNYD